MQKYIVPRLTPRAASGQQKLDLWAQPPSAAIFDRQSMEYAASAPRGGLRMAAAQDLEWMEVCTLAWGLQRRLQIKNVLPSAV